MSLIHSHSRNIVRRRFILTTKGDIGIREMVLLLIFVAVLLVSLLIILAMTGQLQGLADRLDIPVFGELFS